MRYASHVAIGVTDLKRSLRFYEDVLEMEVIREADRQPAKITDPFFKGPVSSARRDVLLRSRIRGDDEEELFVVLSQSEVHPGNEPIGLWGIGIHHVGFWIDDVNALAEKMRRAGIEGVAVGEFSGAEFGLDPDEKLRSLFVQDPDGTILQFDQRLSG